LLFIWRNVLYRVGKRLDMVNQEFQSVHGIVHTQAMNSLLNAHRQYLRQPVTQSNAVNFFNLR